MACILIIDDEELVRLTMRQSLEQAGHQVTEAEDGEQGLQKLHDEAPDLVITDIIMPEKEGIETIAEIRRVRPGMKIVAVSGGGRIGAMDFLKVAAAMGADCTLPKPFSPDELVTVVEKVLMTADRKKASG